MTLSIRSQTTVLHGAWSWDMRSHALYCSDVMSFPVDFEGTKAIIHPDDLSLVSAALSLLTDTTIERLDFRVITTFGEIRQITGLQIRLQAEEQPQPPSGEVPELWETLVQEVAARREAAQLRLRGRLADLSEKIYEVGSWLVNKATGTNWYSDGVFRIFGLPPQSLNAHPNTFLPFIHPEDRALVQDAFEQAYARELPLHIEYRIVQPGGEVRTLRQVSHWSYSEKGEPLLLGVMSDLAQEKDLQAQLEAAEFGSWLQQQVVLQSEKQTSFGYWFMNLVTRKTSFSPNYLRIHGIKPATVPTHTTFLDLVHPDDQELVKGLFDRVYREHVLPEVEYRIIRPDGRQRHLQLGGKLTVYRNNELVMIGVVQDVTGRKGLEKNIAELNDLQALQSLTASLAEQTAEMGTVVWLPNGQMLWSDGFYRMLGYKPQSIEPLLRLWQRGVHPNDLKAFKDAISLAMNQQQVAPFEFRMISKAGVRLLRLTLQQSNPEEPAAIVGLVQDITVRAALIQQQAARERYIRMLEEVSHDLVLYTNTENAITSWNGQATLKTGIRKDDALNQNLFELFPGLREETYLGNLHNALSGTEVRIERSLGGYLSRPHNYQLIPFHNEQDAVVGVLHVVRDVSAELDLQQKLGGRLAFIENLLSATIDRIVVLDQNMNYLYWNARAEAYYALSRDRVLGKNILEVFPGFRNDPSYQEFRRALKGETVHIPANISDSYEGYFETYLIPIKDEDGAVSSVLWIVHDLQSEWQLQQERNRNLELLREEHRRINDAQTIGHIGSFEWNLGEEQVEWSDELYRIIGWEPQSSMITVAFTDELVHPDDRRTMLAIKQQSLSEPGFYAIEHRIVRPDGRIIQVAHRFESFANDAGQVQRVHGTIQDITEQVEARRRLEASENLLRSAEAVAQTGSYEVDLHTMTFRFSEGMYRLFGEEPYAFEPSLAFIDSRSHPDDAAQVSVILSQAVADKQPYHYIRRIQRKDGAWRTLEAHGNVACDAAGNATRFVGLVQDITDRRKAEEEILHLKDEVAQKATDKYQALLRSIDEGFALIEVLFDAEGTPNNFTYREVNQAFERHTGLKDVVGKNVMDVLPDLDPSIIYKYGRVAQTGEPIRFEAMVAALGGIWLNIFASRIGSEDCNQVGIIFENITHRKNQEQKQQYLLRLSDALRSPGNAQELAQTAAGILGETLEVTQVYFAEVATDGLFVALAQYTGEEPVPGSLLWINDWGNERVQRLRSGTQILVNDLLKEPSLVGKADGTGALMVLPLSSGGRLGAVLVVHHILPRLWTDHEISLVTETAERTWSAVEKARAEEHLRNSEARLLEFTNLLEQQVQERTAELKKNITLLQQSEDLAQIGSWDYEIASGRFNWSDRMYALLGKEPGAEVSPETYLEHATAACKKVARKIVTELKTSHHPFEETLHILVGGQEKIIRVKGTVIKDEGGNPVKMVGVDLDITDLIATEARLRESQDLLAQTVAASPDAIIVFEVDSRQTAFLNEVLSRWTGMRPEALLEMGFEGRLQLVHPEDQPALLRFNEQLMMAADDAIRMIDYRLVQGSQTMWLRNRSRVFRRNDKGRVTHLLSILQDVTSEYAAQASLAELNASLQQKNRELEAKNEEITSYAFISSHDLKEPIRKLHTFTDMLRQMEGQRLSENGLDLLLRIANSVQRLDFLIGDILSLSRIHAEHASYEEVSLQEVLERVKTDLKEEIMETGATIISGDLPVFWAIQTQVFYLIKNLVSNALKFQEPGNKPVIQISAQRVEGHAIRQRDVAGAYLKVEVADNGIGFDQKYKDQVFRIFQRLHTREAFSGTGMGLAICRKVMENHRGFIDVESQPGKGTTFCCYFPV